MNRTDLRFGLAAALVLALNTAGCSHKAQEGTAGAARAPLPAARVEVRTVKAATDGGALQAIGRVKNVRESTITARAMGKVVSVAVKSGGTVKAGQLLAKIDDGDAQGRVGQARGALVTALVHANLAVAEYTALQMKQAVVGYGRADKTQIQEMVRRLLALPGLPGPDAADGLGLAITHAHAGSAMARIAKADGLPTTGAKASYRDGRSR